MTRLLWPAVATLVVVAIGAPCLTFYLLIKEYWAEVTLLRQELLICQFGTSGISSKSLFSHEVPLGAKFQKDELSKDGLQPLPVPLPLKMGSSFIGKVKESIHSTTNTVPNPTSKIRNSLSTSSPSSGGKIPDYVPPIKPILLDLVSKDSPLQSLPESPLVSSQNVEGEDSQELLYEKISETGDEWEKRPLLLKGEDEPLFTGEFSSPRFNQFSLDGFMISDDSDLTKNSADGIEKTCLPREYVEKVEKRVVDLTARVDACRKCLEPSRQKESRCGGGAGWREHRRKERLVRRQMREEKRKRRKKEKKNKEKEKGNSNGILVESHDFDITSDPDITSQLPHTDSTTETTPSLPLSDAASYVEWRAEDHTQENHNMRENHRASTDFRRGFNQKISRMDEALMQFTETQSAFCKELRDNLGGRLEKRGQELEALSEQIAAFVRTTTMQVSMIEKLTSDQVYAGQTNIEKNLANLQVLRDAQMKAIQSFHKKTFVPAMVTLASFLSEQASSVTNMGVELITKIEMLQDVYLTFSTQQGDTLVKLSEAVDMFATKHNNLIMRSRDHAKHLHMNTENFIRELQTRMNNVVKELVLVRLQSQSFVTVNENTFHEISASLNKTHGVVDSLSTDLRRRIDKAKDEEMDFRKSFRKETDLINSRIESGISRVLLNNHGAVTQIGEVELETRVFSDRSEAAWNEIYVNQETELRQEADMLTNNLRSHNHHTQNILTGLQGTAGTHEQVLEQQRMDFQSFIRKRQDALDTQCSSISDWALLMSSELRRRDEDLHRFLSEGVHVSTAVTVQEEDYEDFLAPRLPDGTLLYDPSSSDNFPSHRRPTSNVTSLPEEIAPSAFTAESSIVDVLSDGSSFSSLSEDSKDSFTVSSVNNLALPNSSLAIPPPSQKVLSLIIDEVADENATPELMQSNAFTNETDVNQSPSRNENVIQRSNVTGVNISRSEVPITTPDKVDAADNDTLSNEIKVDGNEEFDNSISHQNDQGIESHQTASGCSCSLKSKANHNQPFGDGDNDDEEFKKLKGIVNNAREAIFKFKKVIETDGNFLAHKETVSNTFSDIDKLLLRGKEKIESTNFSNKDSKENKKKVLTIYDNKKGKRKTSRGHNRHTKTSRSKLSKAKKIKNENLKN